MAALEVLAVVEVEREVLVDLDRREVAEQAVVLQAHYFGHELGRLLFVVRRDDGVVQVDGHSVALHYLSCYANYSRASDGSVNNLSASSRNRSA